MSNQNRNISQVRYIEKSNSLLLRTPDGNSYFLNLNLALFHAGIPYKKKNGDEMNVEQIRKRKAIAQERYLKKIKQSNKKENAQAS